MAARTSSALRIRSSASTSSDHISPVAVEKVDVRSGTITANLAGPLVIDMQQAIARQLVIEDPEFPLQVPVSEGG